MMAKSSKQSLLLAFILFAFVSVVVLVSSIATSNTTKPFVAVDVHNLEDALDTESIKVERCLLVHCNHILSTLALDWSDEEGHGVMRCVREADDDKNVAKHCFDFAELDTTQITPNMIDLKVCSACSGCTPGLQVDEQECGKYPKGKEGGFEMYDIGVADEDAQDVMQEGKLDVNKAGKDASKADDKSIDNVDAAVHQGATKVTRMIKGEKHIAEEGLWHLRWVTTYYDYYSTYSYVW